MGDRSTLIATSRFSLRSRARYTSPIPDLPQTDVNEIEKAFSSYNQALVEKKYQELPRYVQVPFVIADGTPRIITSLVFSRRFFETMRRKIFRYGLSLVLSAGLNSQRIVQRILASQLRLSMRQASCR